MASISTHFRVIKKQGIKPLTLAVDFVLSFSILYAGLYGIARFFPEVSRERAYAGLGIPLDKAAVQSMEGAFVWFGDTEKESAGPVVVLEKSPEKTLQAYHEGVFEAESGKLLLAPGSGEILLVEQDSRYISPILYAFVDDILYITDFIRPRALFDFHAVISIFCLTFFGFSLWTLAKLSRWPLFNLWFSWGLVWLVFTGTRFLGEALVPELVQFEQLKWAGPWLPVLFPAICGAGIFLVDFFTSSLEVWKKEMSYD
jgi:hypothetical protein